MPVHVRKRHKGEGGKLYKIVEDATGRVVGQSNNEKDAHTSARIRNEAHAKKHGGKG